MNEAMEEYAKLPFELQRIEFAKHPVGYIQEPFITQVSAFHFPLKGNGRFALNGNNYHFFPGKVIHGCPNKRLTAQVEGDVTNEYITLYYYYDRSDVGYMHCSYELETGVNPRLISMLWRLVALWDKQNAQLSLQVKTLVYSVLSETFSSTQSIQQTNAHSVVEDAKAYVERLYMEQHTLQELGCRYGMNGKYFSDVFKKHTGISPIDFLISCRMEQARKLLESTECSVHEIGKSVGYEDVHYFRRQFRIKTGVSPSEWRERIFQVK